MGHRVNERNIGDWTLDGEPKKRKRNQKLTSSELHTISLVLETVYDAMEFDETIDKFIDGGRIVLSLNREQVYEIFEAKRKIALINK